MKCLERARQHGPSAEVLTEKKPGCVDGALEGALNRCMYHSDVDRPGDIDRLQFAAFLLHSFAKVRHCFTDANKRVAWFSALEVLGTINLTVSVEQTVAAEFVLRVAHEEVSPAEVAMWLAEHLVAY